MAKIEYFVLTAAAFVFTACAGSALANDANTANTAEKNALPGPTKVALVTLEKSAYEAWKSKDEKFWDPFLSDKFVGWGSSGKLDRHQRQRNTPVLIARSRATLYPMSR
jgi:hypothetical protein